MASAIIYASRSTSGSQPAFRRLAERAAQTFLQGVPVSIGVDGYLTEWNGASMTGAIAGVSAEPARNRTTSGVAQVLSTLGISVANQANAVNITLPMFDDGMLNIADAVDDTVFFGEVGPSQLSSSAVIGKNYGMTKDTDGSWYVDLTKVAANTVVVTIVSIDDYDTRGVYFRVLPAAQQNI